MFSLYRMSYSFVSVWTVDDTKPPARTPVVSSDVYASPNSVLTSVSTVFAISTVKTTNLASTDSFVNSGIPLSILNTNSISVSSFTGETLVVPAASGLFINSGGVVSTLTLAPVLQSAFN